MLGITLNNRYPIHEQLKKGIEKLVLKGVLEPDSPLPSVRELAADLAINPNTVQKAYTELEREGITYSVNGKGRFVTSNVEVVRRAKINQALEELAEDLNKLKSLGASDSEISEFTAKHLKEGNK